MAKDLAVVLCDGGLNSCVTAALAAQKYRLVMIHGLPAAAGYSRRQSAFELLSAHFKPYRQHTIHAEFLLAARLRSAAAVTTRAAPVTEATESLQLRLNDLFSLVGIASRYAYAYGAGALYHGMRIGSDTGGGAGGPLGTGLAEGLAAASEFNHVLAELMNLPLGQPDVEVVAPLLELEPWQVVDLGIQVAAPLEKAWSCTEDAAVPCGMCTGCRGRAAAFDRAAKRDPQRRPK